MVELREFLGLLEERGLLKRVKAEVDWKYEVGALTTKVLHAKGPALLFENVKSYRSPLLTGALGTWERCSMAIGVDPAPQMNAEPRTAEGCVKKVLSALKNPIEPVIVDTGPCKEIIDKGEEVNAEKFPSPWWAPADAGRDIGTLGCVVQKDPETGVRNIAIYRQQLFDRRRIGLMSNQQGRMILEKYIRMGKPMPIATAIGVPPEVLVASSTSAPYGFDEYTIAGGIAGKPVRLVKCETLDLEVPAESEIVLEGEIRPDETEWLEEGVFGEFSGFYGGARTKRPTIDLKAITHRNNPITQGTIEGKPDVARESVYLRSMGQSAGTWYRLEAARIPGFSKFYLPETGCACFVSLVSMDHHYYAGNAQQLIKAAQVFGHNAGKITIAADDDIDIFNPEEVEWAVSTRVQPHRDISITKNDEVAGNLDPSIAPEDRAEAGTKTSRMGINATMYYKGFDFPAKVLQRKQEEDLVHKRWAEYGIE